MSCLLDLPGDDVTRRRDVLLVPIIFVIIISNLQFHSNYVSATSPDQSEDRIKGLNLAVQIVNATSLKLRWTPPTSTDRKTSCPGERYTIRLRQDGVPNSRSWRLDGERESVTLHDLHPSTVYEVRLMKVTCEGKRRSSKWVRVTTADLPAPQSDLSGTQATEKQAPGLPIMVRTQALADSIVVTWSAPDDSRTLIRGYMIGYGEGVPDVNWRYVSHNQREVTLRGLKPGSQYVVSVRALNNVGKGLAVYDVVSTKELPSTASLIGGGLPSPTNLRSTILSPSTVQLHWSDPGLDLNQKISDERYYNVYYQPMQPSNSKNQSVIVKALHVTLYDLLPGKLYQFKVRTVKAAQTSPFSESITNKTYGGSQTVSERTKNVNRTVDDIGNYDYEEDIRTVGDTASGQRNPLNSDRAKDTDGIHAEIKRKRAHSVTQESLARTLNNPINNSNGLSPGLSSSGPKVSFRSMVQHRISSYITWPERLQPCSAATPANSSTAGSTVAGYIFRYKTITDAGEYIARNLAANFILLENLLPNTKYKYQVKYVMDKGSASEWSQESMLDTNYYPSNL